VKVGVCLHNPRYLPPLGDTRALTQAVADLEHGHVMGFRIDPALGAFSPPVAALRF